MAFKPTGLESDAVDIPSRRAVAVALQHSEETAPRTHRLPVLVGHDPRDLVQMSHVMSCPGRQQLRQGDDAEGWVSSTPLEVPWLQIQGSQLVQVLRPQPGEFIQQLAQRLACDLPYVSQAIERLESAGFAELQHRPRARHPIRTLGMNQVADDLEDVPGVLTFITVSPRFGQIAQQPVESSRRAAEQRDGVAQVVWHHLPRSSDSWRPAGWQGCCGRYLIAIPAAWWRGRTRLGSLPYWPPPTFRRAA